MTNYIKNSNHYGQKCLEYVDTKGQTNYIDYEDDDQYNALLHNDEQFAKLSIALHETLINTDNSNKEWDVAFTTVKNYLISINKFTGGVGSFRSN